MAGFHTLYSQSRYVKSQDVILITGGAGFIGSHLVERLVQRGDRVIVLDDFNPFYAPQIKRQNISGVLNHPLFTLVEGDIRNLAGLRRLFDYYKIKRVVHLAARAGVQPSLQEPLLYEEVNTRGTANILEACKESGIDNLLIASTSAVYGNTSETPFKEDAPADQPISPYAASKRASELLAYTYHHLYAMPITCLRFFTVYGPRQRPDMAFHKFTRRILSGQPIKLFGDGTTGRDYTFVTDIVDGLTAALDRPRPFEIVNLGNSAPVQLSQVLQIFQDVMPREVLIEHHPEQPGDMRFTCANISKARHLYGYNPTVTLAEGIAAFARWYMTHQTTEVSKLRLDSIPLEERLPVLQDCSPQCFV